MFQTYIAVHFRSLLASNYKNYQTQLPSVRLATWRKRVVGIRFVQVTTVQNKNDPIVVSLSAKHKVPTVTKL